MALRGYHLGHGAGHWPCAALCSAADQRPAERLACALLLPLHALLLFLFAKQNVKVTAVVMKTACGKGNDIVWLRPESQQSFKDRTCAKSADVSSSPLQSHSHRPQVY